MAMNKKSNGDVAISMFDFLNVPLSKSIEGVKDKLKNFDTAKTVYVIAFVGAIAFIAQGLYAFVTTVLAVLVAAWSLKNLMAV
jgi:hypothetical protein